jgi:hypothetical protein
VKTTKFDRYAEMSDAVRAMSSEQYEQAILNVLQEIWTDDAEEATGPNWNPDARAFECGGVNKIKEILAIFSDLRSGAWRNWQQFRDAEPTEQ